MKNNQSLKDSSEKIFRLIVRLLASLGVDETASEAVVFCILPKPQQQYQLIEWIVDQVEKNEHKPTEVEIIEQAEIIAEETMSHE
jgi:hypothetical protein